MQVTHRPRVAIVRNQHAEIILETAPPEDLPPLDDVAGPATEPPHTGATWKAPAPQRRTSLRRRAAVLAMRAVPWALVAFTAYILLVRR
jgi:hypothetical protein